MSPLLLGPVTVRVDTGFIIFVKIISTAFPYRTFVDYGNCRYICHLINTDTFCI